MHRVGDPAGSSRDTGRTDETHLVVGEHGVDAGCGDGPLGDGPGQVITNGKADAKCLAEAVRTLGSDLEPSGGYHFVGGTAGDDFFDRAATAGPDVFCGFGGDNYVNTLDAGDIFFRGDGNDADFRNFGTFYGEACNYYVLYPDDSTGTFVD
jgi:hypothetical protein